MAAYKRAVELMEAELGDELVALDVQRGECFGFNSVATSVWHELREPKSFEQLRDGLLEKYEVDADECSQGLEDLLNDLTARGFIVLVP